MHNGRCVEEIIHGQPFHKELEFICKMAKFDTLKLRAGGPLCSKTTFMPVFLTINGCAGKYNTISFIRRVNINAT